MSNFGVKRSRVKVIMGSSIPQNKCTVWLSWHDISSVSFLSHVGGDIIGNRVVTTIYFVAYLPGFLQWRCRRLSKIFVAGDQLSRLFRVLLWCCFLLIGSDRH